MEIRKQFVSSVFWIHGSLCSLPMCDMRWIDYHKNFSPPRKSPVTSLSYLLSSAFGRMSPNCTIFSTNTHLSLRAHFRMAVDSHFYDLMKISVDVLETWWLDQRPIHLLLLLSNFVLFRVWKLLKVSVLVEILVFGYFVVNPDSKRSCAIIVVFELLQATVWSLIGH